MVDSDDIIQIHRFVNRVDVPNSATNEFQRADSATYNPATSTYGNGVIDADDIIQTRVSERGQTRLDDQLSEAAMEDRKKQGYF